MSFLFYLHILFYYETTMCCREHLTISEFYTLKPIATGNIQSHSLLFAFICIQFVFLEAISLGFSRANRLSFKHKLKK